MLGEYYRKRAAEYDAFYADPQRQNDLATLRAWLVSLARGRHILEVAAGTGYWTAVAAPVAASITATDVNAETLAIAAGKHLGAHVTLLQADAWDLSHVPQAHAADLPRGDAADPPHMPQASTADLPHLPRAFDLGMAHLWWSHLRRQDRRRFLTSFAASLQPAATLLMIDETLVPQVGAPIARRDADGNTWQRRWLDNGERFEIVKNYPDAEELQHDVAATCDDIRILQLKYFWALSSTVRDVGGV